MQIAASLLLRTRRLPIHNSPLRYLFRKWQAPAKCFSSVQRLVLALTSGVVRYSSRMSTGDSSDSDGSASESPPVSGDVVPYDDGRRRSSSEHITARPYQLELLDAALCENTIVNLGTGAGKTFIAVMLIKELSHQILDRPFSASAKRTVFIVNTVPLVKQQAEYIETHTLLDVGHYYGDMNVDAWPKNKWMEELSKYHVVVMTHTIFKNLLHQGFIHLKNVNLLVIDECHHAVKNHEYVQIMKVFDSCREDQYPRILGLSASLLPSKCKPGNLEKKVKELEITLRCRSQTAGDIAEVTRYATNPDEETQEYSSVALSPHSDELWHILCEPLEFLNSLPKSQRDEKCCQIAKVHLDDCQHVLQNLGIWCALQCAEEGISGLTSTLSSDAGHLLEPFEKAFLGLSLTHLQLFTKKCREIQVGDEVDVTWKVQVLISCLIDHLSPNALQASASKALGIIFVERRTTAVLLTRLLRVLSRSNYSLRHTKCDYIVGHGDTKGYTNLRKETHMKAKKQQEILERFRKEKINLLISTSVVEEGLDVPKCNLVIRFDFPPNFRAYLQSKGRARAKPSKYILLIEREQKGVMMENLYIYQILEKELQSLCLDRVVPDDEELLQFLEEEEENIYTPYGKEAGVRATLSTSLPLLHKYCQKFSDKYTSSAPTFNCEAREPREYVGVELEYRSTVQLPISCPIREPIMGHWMPTRRFADKSAALMVIRELHKRKELDEHLKIVSKDLDSEDELGEAEKAHAKHAGTGRRKQYYRNEVGSSLCDCFPKAGSGNYLYVLLMEEVNSTTRNFMFSKEPPEGPHHGVGILTQKPIPHQQVPEFSLYEGKMEINIKVANLPTAVSNLTAAEISILKKCHQALFKDVLKICPSQLSCSFEEAQKNFLIVPLGILPLMNPLEAFIDFELASKAVETGNLHTTQSPIEWPCSIENAVVTKAYPCERFGLFEVKSVNTDITPHTQFPSSLYASYADYYLQKYQITFNNLSQPALSCKQISFSEARLRMLTSRFKDTHGDDLDQRTSESKCEDLFPEVLRLYPLPASFLKVIRCLPSILWRIESVLLVNDVRSDVTQHTGIGRLANDAVTLDVTTCTQFRGYQDYGLGNLETKWDFSYKSETVTDPNFPPAEALIVRGPDNALLLQALTPTSANDTIDNERLETLGDSFLKLATATFLFCERPDAYEGRLTAARMRRIGNLNLYLLANKRKLVGKILSKKFDPRKMWIPPCFTYTNPTAPMDASPTEESSDVLGGVAPFELPDHEREYVYHRVTDKGAADCIESLIGAYLVAGGIEAALRFMKWLGLKIVHKRGAEDAQDEDMPSEGELESGSSSESLGLPRPKQPRRSPEYDSFDSNTNFMLHRSPQILMDHFGPIPPALFDPSKRGDVMKLLKISTGSLQPQQIQGEINWIFREPALLLQALTHASYQRNRVTHCYQRLEFLGDAVLDYLITIHIYSRFPHFGPGKITDMRSALVNNNIFAELAIRLKLHKAFLHNSPTLFKLIPEYVKAITQQPDATDEEDDEYSGAPPANWGTEEEEDSDSDEETDDLEPPKVLGDLLESLAGAIFMDSGMDLQAVWTIFEPLFTEKIEQFKDKIPMPPIRELHQTFPGTRVKCTHAGPGKTRCTLTIPRDGMENFVVVEEANSRKAAKNVAARTALRKLSRSK